MKIEDVIGHNEKKTLTCSMVAEIFAGQLYQHTATTYGADNDKTYAIPHAQMHTREGFFIPPLKNPTPTPLTSDQALLQVQTTLDRKKIWEEWDSQLFAKPSGVTLYNTGTANAGVKGTVPESERDTKDKSSRVFMDEQMTDQSVIYNRRTGLPPMGVVKVRTYWLKITVPNARPKLEQFVPADEGNPADPGPFKTRPDYDQIRKKGPLLDIEIQEDKNKYLPSTDGSNPHSMFEDTESAIMALTAALMSSAGLTVLKALQGKSREVSLMVQSKTAVLALAKTVTDKAGTNDKSTNPKRNDAVKMVDRVNTLNDKRQLTGAYVLTPKVIKIVCSSFSEYPKDQLMIVSHYPMSAGYDEAEDKAETTQGVSVPVAIDDPLPVLAW